MYRSRLSVRNVAMSSRMDILCSVVPPRICSKASRFARLIWENRVYHGLLLIRGKQLDGSHQVRFDNTLLPEIALDISQATTQQWTERPSDTRLQASGCYVYQMIDGLTQFDV